MRRGILYPDPREDLKSRSPNLGPYTIIGYFIGTPLRDLLLDPPGGLGIYTHSNPIKPKTPNPKPPKHPPTSQWRVRIMDLASTHLQPFGL